MRCHFLFYTQYFHFTYFEYTYIIKHLDEVVSCDAAWGTVAHPGSPMSIILDQHGNSVMHLMPSQIEIQ